MIPTRVIRLLFIAAIVVIIVHFFLFWQNAIIDSYFYWAFGEYLRTGSYPFAAPFIYARPTTIEPPLYSVLLMLLQFVNRADILLHAVQLLMLAATGYFLYRSLLLLISPDTAAITGLLFILLPANLIYASLILSETGAAFWLSLFQYTLLLGVVRKNTRFLALSVLTGMIMTIWKYMFLLYALFAFLLFLRRKPGRTRAWAFVSAGLVVLASWVIISHAVTGVWGLSDSRGVHFYNQLVWKNEVLPNVNDPSLQKIREYVPPNVSLNFAYWDLQQYIIPRVHNEWAAFDKILGMVAFAAIREHPLGYMRATFVNLVMSHFGGPPYWEDIGTFTAPYPKTYPRDCSTWRTIVLCMPIIRFRASLFLWDGLVRIADAFAYVVFPVLVVGVLLPSIIFFIARGNQGERMTAFLYLIGAFGSAATEHADARYLVPLYPILFSVCALGISRVLPLITTQRMPHVIEKIRHQDPKDIYR
jgi:hypothetical protein